MPDPITDRVMRYPMYEKHNDEAVVVSGQYGTSGLYCNSHLVQCRGWSDLWDLATCLAHTGEEGGGAAMEDNTAMEDLTEREMEVLMTVFRSFETGLREATIYPKVWIRRCTLYYYEPYMTYKIQVFQSHTLINIEVPIIETEHHRPTSPFLIFRTN